MKYMSINEYYQRFQLAMDILDQNQAYFIQLLVVFFNDLELITKEKYEVYWNQWPTDFLTSIIMIQTLSKLMANLMKPEKKPNKKLEVSSMSRGG